MMFFSHTVLLFSSVAFLRDLRVSGCDLNCTDKPEFDPSSVVVKYGDPLSARCSACKSDCQEDLVNLERSLGVHTRNGTKILWTVENMTEWDTNVFCYYTDVTDRQCCTRLPITVYKPPEHVSISFQDHSGPMLEGRQYTLQCEVKNVAPAENLTVTFYRGRTALGQRRSNNTEKKPVTEIFTLNITPSKEDDGVHYWCEAKLELGPEGPQHSPVVNSQNINSTVHYKPQLQVVSHTDQITVTEGQPLQLNCMAVGNPSPSYSWELPSASPLTSSGGILATDSAAFKHGGQYICNVSNAVETVRVKFVVVVKFNYIPYIIAAVALGGTLLLTIALVTLIRCYRRHRMGQYNLKDVLRLGVRHVAVPTGE